MNNNFLVIKCAHKAQYSTVTFHLVIKLCQVPKTKSYSNEQVCLKILKQIQKLIVDS